jgi:hypothetical protein
MIYLAADHPAKSLFRLVVCVTQSKGALAGQVGF